MLGEGQYISHNGIVRKLHVQQFGLGSAQWVVTVNDKAHVVLPVSPDEVVDEGMRSEDLIWKLIALLLDRVSSEQQKVALLSNEILAAKNSGETGQELARNAQLNLEDVQSHSNLLQSIVEEQNAGIEALNAEVKRCKISSEQAWTRLRDLDFDSFQEALEANTSRLQAHEKELLDMKAGIQENEDEIQHFRLELSEALRQSSDSATLSMDELDAELRRVKFSSEQNSTMLQKTQLDLQDVQQAVSLALEASNTTIGSLSQEIQDFQLAEAQSSVRHEERQNQLTVAHSSLALSLGVAESRIDVLAASLQSSKVSSENSTALLWKANDEAEARNVALTATCRTLSLEVELLKKQNMATKRRLESEMEQLRRKMEELLPAVACMKTQADLSGSMVSSASEAEEWLRAQKAPKDKDGRWTTECAQIAAARGRLDVLKWLFALNIVDLKEKNVCGRSVAHTAAEHGHVEVLKWLRALGFLNLAERDGAGFTVALIAGYSGQLEVLKLMQAIDLLDVKECDKDGYTVSLHAARSGRLEVLKWLHALDLLDSKQRTLYGRNLAHLAAIYEQVEVLEWCQMEGLFDANAQDRAGRNVVHLAAAHGRVEVLKWMHAHGLLHLDAKDEKGATIIAQCAPAALAWLKSAHLV